MSYDLVMCDPPWSLKLQANYTKRQSYARELPYKTMGFEEILCHHRNTIMPKMSSNHNLFLWIADQVLELSLSNYRHLGYRRHAILIWDKGNGPSPAMSVRYSHEYLVWYYMGKFQPISESCRGKFETVFCESPREHSRKPDLAYQMLELMYPEAVKLDAFSREWRRGWDQLGDECSKFK